MTWVFGTVREDIVWFNEFASERSVNNVRRAGWLAPLTHVAFNVSTFATSGRRDWARTYGGGLGYHVGRDLRIGFNVDHHEGSRSFPERAYDGRRYGAVLTYGR